MTEVLRVNFGNLQPGMVTREQADAANGAMNSFFSANIQPEQFLTPELKGQISGIFSSMQAALLALSDDNLTDAANRRQDALQLIEGIYSPQFSQPGAAQSGSGNFAVGLGAGATITTGRNNICIGPNAGSGITTQDDIFVVSA